MISDASGPRSRASHGAPDGSPPSASIAIAELRDLLSRATAGEWVVLHESVWRERGHDQPATVAWVADWCVARSGPSYEFHGENQDDARLIAAAKNSMAALLDAYEEREVLRDLLRTLRDDPGVWIEGAALEAVSAALKEPSDA